MFHFRRNYLFSIFRYFNFKSKINLFAIKGLNDDVFEINDLFIRNIYYLKLIVANLLSQDLNLLDSNEIYSST